MKNYKKAVLLRTAFNDKSMKIVAICHNMCYNEVNEELLV